MGNRLTGGPNSFIKIIVWTFAGCLVIGIIAAITIPNFLKHRSNRQYEAKTNLRALATMEAAFFSTKNRYAASFAELEWSPTLSSKFYTYYLSDTEVIKPKPPVYSMPEGVHAWATDKGFLAVAVANLDSDPVLDVWVIDDKGNLQNIVDDLK